MPKKVTKKSVKSKAKTTKAEYCDVHGGFCFCKFLFTVLIIVFVWVSSATWSKILITIAAVLIMLCAHCPCKAPKKQQKQV